MAEKVLKIEGMVKLVVGELNGRERGWGWMRVRESMSRFERIQETVDARDADSKEGTGRNANASSPGYLVRM
jgi:hypothetical protein